MTIPEKNMLISYLETSRNLLWELLVAEHRGDIKLNDKYRRHVAWLEKFIDDELKDLVDESEDR